MQTSIWIALSFSVHWWSTLHIPLGVSFCKKYASLGIIQVFLPKSTPIIAVTVTLTLPIQNDLFNYKASICSWQLPFHQHWKWSPKCLTSGSSNGTSNEHLLWSRLPSTKYMGHPEDIKKGFLYWDDINIGGNIVDHLNAHVVVEFCGQGLICSYNAAMSRKYWADVMQLFKAGPYTGLHWCCRNGE